MYSPGLIKLANASNKLASDNINALLVTSQSNIRYLTGFRGDSAYLLLTAEGSAFFITDGRFIEQAEDECPPQVSLILLDQNQKPLPRLLCDTAKAAGIKQLAFEEDQLTYAFLRQLQDAGPDLKFTPSANIIEELRLTKDADEVANIRIACTAADKAFARLLACLSSRNSERELAYLLLGELLAVGAEDLAFPSIIAAGANSSLCHAIPSDRKLVKGDFLLCDFGAQVDGYKSDITRTVVFGKADELQKDRYNAVLEAQLTALATAAPGVTCGEVDAACRKVLAKYGLEDYFTHGLGHGVGLDIHEAPRVAKNVDTVLKEGMIITIEPGIYLPGWGGIRIEDTVLITAEGAQALTHFTKELIQI